MQSLQSWYGLGIAVILAAMSVYLVALAIVRFMFFKKMTVNSTKLLSEVHLAVTNNDTKMLADLGNQRASDPPLRILLGTAISNQDLPENELREIFSLVKMKQKERLSKGLSAFGTMATIAPFVGLLGTVIGVIEAFEGLAASGAAGPNVVSSGVAAALWATALGLCVAIPSVVGYNIFGNKAKRIISELEVVGHELIILFRNAKRHKK